MGRPRSVALVAAIAVYAATYIGACGPRVPPTTVPQPPRAELEAFREALQKYVDETQPFRKAIATQTAARPNQGGSSPETAEAVRARARDMAEAIRTQVRPQATQGEIFSDSTAAIIRRDVQAAYDSPKVDLIRDELREQAEGEPDVSAAPRVNETLKAPLVPPMLRSVLPQLPEQVAYDFAGRALILRDVDANIVVDYIPDALPEAPSKPPPAPPSAAGPVATQAVLPVPDVRGGTVFAAIGDSGSGDRAQYAVAEAIARYFTASRHIGFVIMLGDNLYNDDYNGEFLDPYKPLLDRGVTFYAALGNHDRDLEEHFKPFNMEDRLYYAFNKGNARFVALDSNRLDDEAQMKWFDTAYGDTGNRWRIAFFHHPLYSSGKHADQSREVIRPALEQALIRNKVNVVFSGHEHLYERIAPQHGIHYFVSGGGGKDLYDVHPNPFDAVATSEHHFMVLEIAGDELFFEAVTPEGPLLDCGMLWRTAEAEAKGPDGQTRAWLQSCDRAKPKPVRTTQH